MKFRTLYLVLLVEGAALMAAELMGAKLVAPFYGSSLYVWTAALISTLLGLSLGYYTGGAVSGTKNSRRKLAVVLLLASAFLFAMPYTAKLLILLTKDMSILPGVCITCLALILPPVLCMGMAGPIATKLMSGAAGSGGSAVGSVYFTSTLGGVLATFFLGYYLIPVAGLNCCSWISGLSLALVSLIYLASLSKAGEQEISHAGEERNPVKQQSTPHLPRAVYLFAVAEGATVMVAELLAAHMMAPYFGASLFAWAAVMGFTLAGLAAGYYIGGRLAGSGYLPEMLYGALLTAAVFVVLMHITAAQLTMAFDNVSFDVAIVAVSLLLVTPPLLFLGMIPPLLIRHIAKDAAHAGAIAGKVYAMSSASGIVALALFGFFIIPQYGFSAPALLTGIIIGAAPFAKLVAKKKYAAWLFVPAVLLSISLKKTMQPADGVEVQYYSEGLLGQVLVVDMPNTLNGAPVTDRALFVNRIGETYINKNTGATEANYLVYVACLASKLKAGSNALLLGLGGGTIANMLQSIQFHVDVAELDPRIADVSREYFGLSSNVNVAIDDARHYLEQTDKKYDLIFFDVFRGDIPPAHVLSEESFRRAKSLLTPGGFIMINFFGFLSGDIGKAGRSIYKTLCAAGLHARILPSTGSEEERNLLFVASASPQDFHQLRLPMTLFGKPVDVDTLFVENKTPGLDNATVFTDDKLRLDLMVLPATNNYRKYFDSTYVQAFWKNGVPLFE